MEIKFINHASYIVENDEILVLHDPWLEGEAFNNGWALLSQEISNQDVIEYLNNSDKSIFIWISHEHSDHFNIPFLKELKASGVKCNFLFQKTIDKRVYNYLKSNHFDVTECIDGKEYKLGDDFYFSVFRFGESDSFCFLRANNQNILNINDCVINDLRLAKKVFSRLPNSSQIDVLFTQFGYANWIGRKEDKELRLKFAEEKMQRIFVQDKIFNPRVVIPFASFIYFCKEDNFFMNYEQNGPLQLRQSSLLTGTQKKISFMKPMQTINLDENYSEILQLDSFIAEKYWNDLITGVKNNQVSFRDLDPISIDEILRVGRKFINKVRLNTLFAVMLLEFLRILNLKPLILHIYDLNVFISLSYISGIKTIRSSNDIAFSIHSSEMLYILKNEFGWDTLSVSGAFKAVNSNIDKVTHFFRLQNAIKNGFSYKHPIHTLKVIVRFIYIKFS